MLIKDIYTCICFYSLFCFLVVGLLYTLSYCLASKLTLAPKVSVYECGFEPINCTQTKFSIKFYLVALLFVIFDLEIIFLLPWSIYAVYLGLLGYTTMLAFCGVLTIGFIYEYKKGALDW